MRPTSLLPLLLVCPCWFAGPLQAIELKFTAPADVARSLAPVAAPGTLSVVNEEGGFLRFRSEEKLRYARMAVAPGGVPLIQADGEVSATFRFGGEKESFGLYLRVAGEEDAAYLALVSAWTKGQGTVRLFRVPPKTQVEDQHQLAKENVRSPLAAGAWQTLKVRTAAVPGGNGVQVTAELVPAAGGASTSTTAVDPLGLKDAAKVHLRFYAADADATIDLKQVATPPAAAAAAPAPAATPAARPPGR